MKKTVLREYAKLIVRAGVNVQKGQDVLIYADLDQPEFVQMVVEEAYKAKARKVTVEWNYQPLQKIHVRYRTLKTLSAVEAWEEERQKHYVNTLPCRIHLISEDPDGLRGINLEKLSKGNQAVRRIMKPYRDQRENKEQWCIAAVPGAAWAKKVFPELSRHQAMEKLWEAILSTSRVNDDPVAAWEAHNADLKTRCDYLNSLDIESLHYTADNGTDLTVGMMPQAQFCGGGETSLQDIFFNPNIPTEECFISPKRGVAEGVVYATKPLSYQGTLIEDFRITFKDGKAVEWQAKTGADALEKMITSDEGAAMLGELALVPCGSPIDQLNILFYNTLFDENASCHVALGRGFSNTIEGFESMTKEETDALGINDSMIHVDFMIGAPDLSIKGYTKDGKEIEIFKDGKWAI